jgi:predicted kinase
MLVVFGGLPGTGKTTIAREVARRRAAFYARIDTIEQAIRSANVLGGEIGPAGYAVAMALARENLAAGQVVVADAMNPVPEAREAWRDIAAKLSAPLIEIEVVCSDRQEHRRRVEARSSAERTAEKTAKKTDIAGLVSPTWDEVLARHYVPWTEDHWVIDTSVATADEAVAAVCARMDALSHSER